MVDKLKGMKTMEILLEKYVGKPAECLVMEKEIKNLRRELKKLYDPSKPFQLNSGGLKEVNKGPAIKKISLLIKKLFKFKEVFFFIDPNPAINAYTPTKSLTFLDPNIKKSKDGKYSGNGQLVVGVAVTLGILLDSKITDAEIVGVILHEVGHNLYRSPIQALSMISLTKDFSDLLIQLAAMGIVDTFNLGVGKVKLTNFFKELIDKIPGLTSISTTISRGLGSVLSLLPASKLARPDLLKIISSPMQPIFRYNIEKFADNFATDHGYGQEVATVQAKMEFNHDSLRYMAENNNSPIGLFYQIDSTLYDIFGSIMSGYPTNQNRIKSALSRMETSLNDPNLPPAIKAELKREVKETRDWYDNVYLKTTDDDKRKLTVGMRNLVEKLFDGKADIRELVILIDKEQKAY